VDPSIVRGLDYYTKTAFEIVSEEIGAQGAVCGGGRYDGLVKECGGPDMPGVGFAMGLERIVLAVKAQNVPVPRNDCIDVFAVSIGDETEDVVYSIVKKLRDNGISCDKDYLGRSTRAQLKYADKVHAKYALIVGGDELNRNTALLRDMATGEQQEVPFSELVEVLSNALKKEERG